MLMLIALVNILLVNYAYACVVRVNQALRSEISATATKPRLRRSILGINCICKDFRDKIKVPDPIVKDLISK